MTSGTQKANSKTKPNHKSALVEKLQNAGLGITLVLDRLFTAYAVILTCLLAIVIFVPNAVTPDDKLAQEILLAQDAVQAWVLRMLFHTTRILSCELLEHRGSAYDFARLSSFSRRLSRVFLVSFAIGLGLSVVSMLMAGKAIELISVGAALPGFPSDREWYAAAGSEFPSGNDNIMQINLTFPLMSLLFWLFSLPLGKAAEIQEEQEHIPH